MSADTGGSALVWWLASHMEEVEKAVTLIGPLNRLSAVSQGRDDTSAPGPHLVTAPPLTRDSEDREMSLTIELLNELYPDSSEQRAFFARLLAQLAEQSGQSPYGRRLREQFNAHNIEDDPTEPNDGESTSA